MKRYTGKSKIAAVGPCNSNWGGGWCLMDAIQRGPDNKILVAFEDLDGKLYNAHWCRIHTDLKSGRDYINIHRFKYYLDDFLRLDI